MTKMVMRTRVKLFQPTLEQGRERLVPVGIESDRSLRARGVSAPIRSLVRVSPGSMLRFSPCRYLNKFGRKVVRGG